MRLRTSAAPRTRGHVRLQLLWLVLLSVSTQQCLGCLIPGTVLVVREQLNDATALPYLAVKCVPYDKDPNPPPKLCCLKTVDTCEFNENPDPSTGKPIGYACIASSVSFSTAGGRGRGRATQVVDATQLERFQP